MFKHIPEYFTGIRVGFFLAKRDIANASKWSTVLIIFIMTLTFLNLIVVRGILVGLVEGVRRAYREQRTGDLILTTLDTESEIAKTPFLVDLISELPEVKAVSSRYLTSSVLEANYQTQKDSDEPDTISSFFFGIDPVAEDRLNNFSSLVTEGEYLDTGDVDTVLLGKDLLSEYSVDGEGLDDVHAGDKIRVTVAGETKEVTIKGIVDSKVQDLGASVFMPASQAQKLLGRFDYSADEISIRLHDPSKIEVVRDSLHANDVDAFAKVESYSEAEPAFVRDVAGTFDILANVISSISLLVAAITTFIIIFVNAITQKPLIGILKGIGIHWFAIVSSYTMQAVFYAVIGISVASAIIFFILEPYIAANPINFPFSDGILLVTASGTLYRSSLLLVATVISGFVPAKMIVNKNTLDSILGR